MRFISPKTDFAFKKIFGSEQSKDILISFLNAIIYSGGRPPGAQRSLEPIPA